MTERTRPVSEQDIMALVDGELDPARAAEVEAWLADHPDEARQAEGWRRQNLALKSALDPVAGEPVPGRLSRLAGGKSRRWLAPALSAAAAAIVTFPLGLALAPGNRVDVAPGAGERLARSGIAAHRVYAVEVRHPVEVWGDEEQHLVTWLTRRLGVPVKAPDLAAKGLRLVGGRLLADGGRPAALLMYEDRGGRRYTLVLERVSPARLTAFRYESSEDVGAFYWVDGETGYVLSGPADRAALLEVARAVYGQINPG
ncbi:MAG: anti-sigma factor [Rhodobiaceae bacterium]|nr:anti-sigma factor [Rhodobiaceae bacterium]